jgi:signal transduction histidine kinase
METTAYFIINEALTNVVKHAHASRAQVSARVEHDRLRLEVHDDGSGGADAEQGTGLTGLFDRIDAVGGTLAVTSLPGQGTSVLASLPLEAGG